MGYLQYPSIAGWFISWKIQISNGGFRGTSHLWTPLYHSEDVDPPTGPSSPCPSTAGLPRNLRLRLGGNRLLRLPESFGQLKALRQLALEARRAWGYHGDILYVDVYRCI